MAVEIESRAELVEHIGRAGSLDGVVVQGVDLVEETARLLGVSAGGAVFLGCRMEESALDHVHASGALVFPLLDDLPYRPYRPSLYTVEELMRGYRPGDPDSFARDTVDSAIYRHSRARRETGAGPPVVEALAQRLHDHAIDDALGDLLGDPRRPRRVVAVMGGHGMRRHDDHFTAVAVITRTLTRAGYFVATGGGPGAMEAGNLGAWLAPHDDEALPWAIEVLRQAPHYRDPGYLDRALEVREGVPSGGESLAIPTWFYGHEPTNLFATHIAKYFANSIREEGLLAIASEGVIFAPGSAGTVQEVFMDAAQNHYATCGAISPMVFLGRERWLREIPVFPLLAQLARGRRWADMLCLSDDPREIVAFIESHPPVTP